MDALQSFIHLNNSVPLWLSKLDDLTVSVAEHNARFLEMAQLGNKILKNTNLSTESLREGPIKNSAIEGEVAAKPTDTYVPPNFLHQCIPHAHSTQAVANNTALIRKRKGSIASLTSEQPRYRMKSMVVVYYDSAIQNAFDSLFRSIATARNNLRKGKTAAIFKARMASLDNGQSSCLVTGDVISVNPKFIRAGFGRGTPGPGFNADDKLSSFDEADKDLETAQNLCEVAAHQFLRDGDCRLEINGMRKKFDNCRATARKEMDILREEEEREKEDQAASAELDRGAQLPGIKYVEAQVNPPPPLKEFNLTGTIEIDDQPEAEPVQIDLSAFKTRTRRV